MRLFNTGTIKNEVKGFIRSGKISEIKLTTLKNI